MARTTTCTDCGVEFELLTVKGRPRARCQGCKRKYDADRMREWRANNPVRAKELRDQSNARIQADPVHRRRRRDNEIRRLYGLEPEAFGALLAAQGGNCAICGNPPSGTGRGGQRLHVDHCHSSNAVRGLLCGRCNTMLGLAKEDATVLASAIRYLQTRK
jgi:hypothetical protein